MPSPGCPRHGAANGPTLDRPRGLCAALILGGLWALGPSVARAHDAPEEHPTSGRRGAPPDAAETGAAETTAGSSGPPSDPPATEIVVTGERAPRAASAVVRDRTLLGAAPQATGSELLRTVPGVFVSQHGGQGKAHQIFFRGFDAVHGQDLEIWVAGAPVNEVSNVHGQGYADLHFVMPEIVRRIDALPGSYDPSQGDFAVAGTMRFGLGYGEPGATVRASLGSFDTRRLFLAYHPEGASPETFGAFELFETDGVGVGRAAQRASAVAQLVHPIEDDLQLRLMASSYAGQFGGAGVLRQEDVDRGVIDRFGSYHGGQGGRSTRTQLVLGLLHDDGETELEVSPYVVLRTLNLTYDYTGYLVHPEHGDTTRQHNDSTTIGTRARYRQRLGLFRADDAFELGVSARNDWIDQGHRYEDRGGRPVDTLVDARLRTTTVGAYLDAELHPVKRLLLRGGLRADVASFAVEDRLASAPRRESQGAFVGEKLVADLALAPRLHAVASWGRGFRTPQARGVADGARVPFTRVRSAELGFRWAGGSQRASLAGYATDLSDDVVFDETVGRNEPVPGTRRWGLAAHLETTHDWFASGIGATITRAAFTERGGRFESGQLVPYVPQVVTRIDLAARPVLGTWSGRTIRGHFGLGMQGLFRRPLPYGELGRDALITDLRLGIRREQLELTLDVRNLLGLPWNEGEFVYASRFDPSGPASLIPVRHITAGEPRSVLLSAALHL